MKNRKIKSVEGESILMLNDATNNVICFSTERDLIALSSSNTIFVDGTKCSRPAYFYQLFTVHVNINGHYIP